MFNEIERPESFEDSYTDKAVYLKYAKAPVYYMLIARGDAIEAHIAAHGRDGRMATRKSTRELMEWIPNNYKWCKMLIALVGEGKNTVFNMCIKLGFNDFGVHQFKNGTARVMGVSYE